MQHHPRCSDKNSDLTVKMQTKQNALIFFDHNFEAHHRSEQHQIMRGSFIALVATIVVVLVLVFSQLEITVLAPTTQSHPPVATTLLVNDGQEATANGKLKQRLYDLGQFLTQNSKASQEALEQSEKRIKELEAELVTVQSSHRDRIALLEDRLGNIIPKIANSKQENKFIPKQLPPSTNLATEVKLNPPQSSSISLSSSSSSSSSTSISPSSSAIIAQTDDQKRATFAIKWNLPASKQAQDEPSLSIPSHSIKKTLDDFLKENNAILPNNPTRDDRISHNRKVNLLKKEYHDLLLQEDVNYTNKLAHERGLDFSIRRKLLPQPYGKEFKIPMSSNDVYSAPRREGGIRDLYIDQWAQIAVCTIEKVASSELKKLLHRMSGDAHWRDEPWFKGGLPKIKDEKDPKNVEKLMHDSDWTKMIYLRHPFERLVSCYKDKFGRDNKLYSVRMTGNKSTEVLSFETFVKMIATPNSEHQNQHWRPQHLFCGLKKYLKLFNFVGNFENLEDHAKVFLTATDLWHNYGSNGWGDFNSSMFARNEAAHRTSAGAVTGNLAIDHKKASMSYDKLLPPGSKLRKLAFEYYKKDFEMMASIDIPPFDNTRYKIDLATKGG